MQITSATITYGRQIQLKPYHGVHLEVTFVANLEEGEVLNDVMNTLWNEAKKGVQAQAQPLLDAYKAQAEAEAKRILNGLPEQVRKQLQEN